MPPGDLRPAIAGGRRQATGNGPPNGGRTCSPGHRREVCSSPISSRIRRSRAVARAHEARECSLRWSWARSAAMPQPMAGAQSWSDARRRLLCTVRSSSVSAIWTSPRPRSGLPSSKRLFRTPSTARPRPPAAAFVACARAAAGSVIPPVVLLARSFRFPPVRAQGEPAMPSGGCGAGSHRPSADRGERSRCSCTRRPGRPGYRAGPWRSRRLPQAGSRDRSR